jgi:hypothetical protein
MSDQIFVQLADRPIRKWQPDICRTLFGNAQQCLQLESRDLSRTTFGIGAPFETLKAMFIEFADTTISCILGTAQLSCHRSYTHSFIDARNDAIALSNPKWQFAIMKLHVKHLFLASMKTSQPCPSSHRCAPLPRAQIILSFVPV